MGEMKRAIARERVAWAEKMEEQARMKSTLVIAAAIIAAVRLARDPDISRASPRLTAVVSESVSLARMILDRVGHLIGDWRVVEFLADDFPGIQTFGEAMRCGFVGRYAVAPVIRLVAGLHLELSD